MQARVVHSIDELKGLVGQEIGIGHWFQITQERVNTFADVTGDHQWIHVDTVRAADSPFGGTIVHGQLIIALVGFLKEDWEGVRMELKPKLGINYGLNRVRFMSPVRVGKRVRVRTVLKQLEEVAPNAYQYVCVNTVEIEDEGKPAMVAESITRYYF